MVGERNPSSRNVVVRESSHCSWSGHYLLVEYSLFFQFSLQKYDKRRKHKGSTDIEALWSATQKALILLRVCVGLEILAFLATRLLNHFPPEHLSPQRNRRLHGLPQCDGCNQICWYSFFIFNSLSFKNFAIRSPPQAGRLTQKMLVLHVQVCGQRIKERRCRNQCWLRQKSSRSEMGQMELLF